ncbi:HepT-like ribonuclease domain-containing protein [Cellulomonas pakistanensis]|uniref:DUF86 domain-containing protein n=1 Tax=Cellulomonas pakistanensis TaxID=992287 RepID=A0A919PGE8_9CELL|nr:HepT-like ribonuclease domain-containing protein [Cellulomonas pakistanensis]GIG37697.1 hypothetical protein Cpa01nite_30780 [Cellulomonas pakistanensis]
MKRTTTDLADDALEHLTLIRRYVGEYGLDEEVALDAVALHLSSALDCIGKMPAADRDAACGSEWPQIRSLRNRIAHGYLWIEADVVRGVVREHLDGLEQRLVALVARPDPDV